MAQNFATRAANADPRTLARLVAEARRLVEFYIADAAERQRALAIVEREAGR